VSLPRATIARMAVFSVQPALRPSSTVAREPAPHLRFFRPFWESDPQRNCRSCRHAIGWDSVHVFCQRAAIVPVYPCGHWEREAGCD